MALPEGTRIQVLAPVVRAEGRAHRKVLEDARRAATPACGWTASLRAGEDIPLEKNKKHHIEIVVDRLIIRPDIAQRPDGLRGDGLQPLRRLGGHQPGAGGQRPALLPELRLRGLRHLHRGTDRRACSPSTTPSAPAPPAPAWAPSMKVDPELVIPDKELSILDGAITPWVELIAATASPGCTSRPWRRSTTSPWTRRRGPLAEAMDIILYGTRARS